MRRAPAPSRPYRRSSPGDRTARPAERPVRALGQGAARPHPRPGRAAAAAARAARSRRAVLVRLRPASVSARSGSGWTAALHHPEVPHHGAGPRREQRRSRTPSGAATTSPNDDRPAHAARASGRAGTASTSSREPVNVVRGDMSLVGPGPLPAVAQTYRERDRLRHAVAGLRASAETQRPRPDRPTHQVPPPRPDYSRGCAAGTTSPCSCAPSRRCCAARPFERTRAGPRPRPHPCSRRAPLDVPARQARSSSPAAPASSAPTCASGCWPAAPGRGLDNFVTGEPATSSTCWGHDFRLLRCDVTDYVHVPGPLDRGPALRLPGLARSTTCSCRSRRSRSASIGTLHALGLAKEKGARFLLASTSETYGDPQVHPQPESYWGHVNPVGPRGVYDEAKRFAEALTMAYRRTHGVDTAIVRIFNTYGPRMRPDDGRAIPAFVTQALAGEPITVAGDGSQTRSVCYVDDLVDGHPAAAPSGLAGPGQHRQPARADACWSSPRRSAGCAGRTREIVFVPRPQDDPTVRQPDITLAREQLGWEPQVTLEDGLRSTLAYFAGLGERHDVLVLPEARPAPRTVVVEAGPGPAPLARPHPPRKDSMKVVLITGAGGLVGAAAARRYVQDADLVVGIDNDMRALLLRRGGLHRVAASPSSSAGTTTTPRRRPTSATREAMAKALRELRQRPRAGAPRRRAAVARLGRARAGHRFHRQRQRHAGPARADAPARARRGVHLHQHQQGLRRHAEPRCRWSSWRRAGRSTATHPFARTASTSR